MSDMLEIMGFWKKQDKNGNVYLAGRIGGLFVTIQPNMHKKEDKHPDYRMCVSPAREKPSAGPRVKWEPKPEQSTQKAPPPIMDNLADAMTEDSIPF